MQNFKNRALYFELENALQEASDFSEKIKSVKIISDWASEQLGYDIHESEAYARAHIANIVRENQVSKMIKRIQNDLIDNNIDVESDLIIERSKNLLKNVSIKLNTSKN